MHGTWGDSAHTDRGSRQCTNTLLLWCFSGCFRYLYLSIYLLWQFFSFTAYILTQISVFSTSYILKTDSFMLYQTKMSVFDTLGMRLNNQLIFLVCLGTARTNPTDSTFKFCSLCITIIGREDRYTLNRNVPQRKSFYFYTLSIFQNLYFIIFTRVKKLSQYFQFYVTVFLHKYLYFT